MKKMKHRILKIIQIWKALPKDQVLLMLWWIFLLILIFAGFGPLVAVIYFPYLLLKKIIKYTKKK